MMTLECQLCWANLDSLSVAERQNHYDCHFLDKSAPNLASSSAASSWIGKVRLPTPANLEKNNDVFWYPAMKTLPPSNFTPGLIPVLKKALLNSHAKGTTTRAVLCYERAVLIHRQMWDANWGCGYRNFLMSCAALMDQPYQPMYFPLLDQPIPPGIRNLQTWIEEAWKNGFDSEGHKQLKKLVDTKKWIGTTDICVAFISRGIPAELVDFELHDPKKGLAPLTNWIVQYFNNYTKLSNSATTVNAALSGASPVICAPCMPLILQNAGHSRMVVGYELTKSGGVTLLVFDPSKPPSKHLRNAALSGVSSALTNVRNKRSSNEIQTGNGSTDSTSKRFKTRHVNNSDTSADDDETEFVNERVRIGSEEIEIVGEVRRVGKSSTSAVNEPSYADVLKHFRWENRSFKRRNKYQILYFPLEEPLSETEMGKRKVLASEQVV